MIITSPFIRPPWLRLALLTFYLSCAVIIHPTTGETFCSRLDHDARAISIAIVERSSSIAQEVVGASSSSSSSSWIASRRSHHRNLVVVVGHPVVHQTSGSDQATVVDYHTTDAVADAVAGSCNNDESKTKESSRMKKLVISMIRGGHYDLTNHYDISSNDVTNNNNPPPPPPPPPPLPPVARSVNHGQYGSHRTHESNIAPSSTNAPANIDPYPSNIRDCHQHQPEQHTNNIASQTSHPTSNKNNNFPPLPPSSSPSSPPPPPNAQYFPPGTWERYLRATNHNPIEAHRRLTSTQTWRRTHDMNAALTSPHPTFDVIKRYYPHSFHSTGYHGEPVYYEKPARIDLPALKREGVTMDRLLHHYAIITEFLWTHLSPYQDGPSSKGITVIDLDGMRLRDFAGEVVAFVKAAASFTGEHYPERSGRIYVLNAPSFFGVVWRLVKPLVDPVTLAKVCVVDSSSSDGDGDGAIRAALMERIPFENIPREYGGGSMVPLGYAPEEIMLRDLMSYNNNPQFGGS